MKKLTLSIFALLLCILLGSCSKEELNTAGTGTSFKMSVVATAPQIEADTKAELHNVIVYSFNNGDAISVVNVSSGTYLGNLQARVDDPSSSTVQKMVTTRFSGELSGSINKGDKLAFIYPAMDGTANTAFEGYSVDLSNQVYNGSTVPFTAYSQMESPFASSDNEAMANDLFISFTNVTSYLVLNIQGMPASTNMDKLTLTRVNNGIDWSIAGGSIAAAPSGDNVEKIVLDCSGKDVKTSSIGAKSLYLAVPACNLADYRNVIVELGSKRYDSPFSKSALAPGKFYSQNIKVEEYLPYVEIEADYDQDPSTPPTKLRWAKENLAISPSGKREFNHTGHINGDYFQWAAYAGYCGNATDADKGLLIYESFTSEMCGDDSNAFTFKSAGTDKKYIFNTTDSGNYIGISPYYNKTDNKYTAYTDIDSKVTLESTDDVANIILGGNWRIPTSAEFKAMYNATTWTWESTDKGYYVTEIGVALAFDKSNALLFFPAAGTTASTVNTLGNVGKLGFYRSSSLSNSHILTSYLYFDSSSVKMYGRPRYDGHIVRPVTDVPGSVQSEITNPFGGDEVDW